MKKPILLVALSLLLSNAKAQLLFTDSLFLSSDSGHTYETNSVSAVYHDSSHCREASVFVQNADPVTHQLINKSYGTTDYYDNGNVKQNVFQSWDPNSHTYINAGRTTYTYYLSSSKIRTYLNETWQSHAWRNSTLETETYDVKGYLVEDVYQIWDTLMSVWQNSYKTVYYNNSRGLADSSIEITYQNNSPTNNYKIINTYDTSGMVFQAVYQTFDSNQWHNTNRYSYTYDTSGNLTFSTSENYVNNQWLISTRSTLTYYAKGKFSTTLDEVLSPDTQTWTPTVSNVFTYGDDSNVIEQTLTLYVYGTSTILNIIKSRFHYEPCKAIPVAIVELCDPMGSATLNAVSTGTRYQWQLSSDSINFNNITDNSNYSGSGTAKLSLSNIPSAWYGYQYRYSIDGNTGGIFTIKFVNNWTGAANTVWNNPLNWSCGEVPDSNTDVFIDSGSVILDTSTSIRSITIEPGASLTVNPGVILKIKH